MQCREKHWQGTNKPPTLKFEGSFLNFYMTGYVTALVKWSVTTEKKV